MGPHLNDGQIEELFRPAWNGNAESPFDRGALEDIQAHLKTCDSCRERVLAQQRVMEQLALLKSNAPVSPGLLCPPDGVWIEVAAGIANPDAEKYLSHAMNCDHCGQLLNQAAGDFDEELTPQEEAQIASLASSTTAWQTKVAVRLQGIQAVSPAGSAPKPGWSSSMVAFLTPSRLALVAALAALILLGIGDYRLTGRLSSQSLQASADVNRLQRDVDLERAQIAELTAQLNKPAPSAPQPVQEANVASLTLDSGLSRGTGEMKRLSVPSGAGIVRITLHSTGNPDGVMREELLTVDRRKIWSQELRPSDAERKSGSLTLLIPAYLLTPEDYLIVLSRELPDGPEQVATYSFRVPR